ncbi:MAG: succinate dehydrogenase [Phycisphaerae bacterium]|nr:succinate dehydrogenase [Phycisphaerae bacterium]
MAGTQISLPQQAAFAQTSRPGAWWLQPLAVFLGLSAFIVYSTWAALQGVNYHHAGSGADLLSPFYSPVLWDAPGTTSGHAWLGSWPAWWPAWLPASPALLILWAPGGFRFTCYYYRGAYYKAFWADPPACAVGEPRKSYLGENTLPLILQNVHRYFLYVAIIFIGILAYDAYKAMWFKDAEDVRHFGLSVGTLVLCVNATLLSFYTFGCHSLRHLIGGRCNRLAEAPLGKKTYDCVSCLNRRHMLWAWCSLFWVGFTDVYVRLCATGTWSDMRIL